MTVRFACEKDIPQMNSLLYQVERVHQQGRPDLFKEGAKKYTDNELKDMLKDKTKPIFAAVDENDVMKGYAFCVFQEHKGDNVLTDIKTLYIDDLCVDENCRGQHIGSVLYIALLHAGHYLVECTVSAAAHYKVILLSIFPDLFYGISLTLCRINGDFVSGLCHDVHDIYQVLLYEPLA